MALIWKGRAMLAGQNVWKMEVRLEGQSGTRREILGQIAEAAVSLLWNFPPPFPEGPWNEEVLMIQAPHMWYRNRRWSHQCTLRVVFEVIPGLLP